MQTYHVVVHPLAFACFFFVFANKTVWWYVISGEIILFAIQYFTFYFSCISSLDNGEATWRNSYKMQLCSLCIHIHTFRIRKSFHFYFTSKAYSRIHIEIRLKLQNNVFLFIYCSNNFRISNFKNVQHTFWILNGICLLKLS